MIMSIANLVVLVVGGLSLVVGGLSFQISVSFIYVAFLMLESL